MLLLAPPGSPSFPVQTFSWQLLLSWAWTLPTVSLLRMRSPASRQHVQQVAWAVWQKQAILRLVALCALLRSILPSTFLLHSGLHYAAGMRVIGVSTTLTPAVMQSAAPDWIQADVLGITVADIQGLKLSLDQQQLQRQVPA